MRKDTRNDSERSQWVDNDEGLYQWFMSQRRQGGGMRGFIRRNRAEIDAAIDKRLNPPQRPAWMG